MGTKQYFSNVPFEIEVSDSSSSIITVQFPKKKAKFHCVIFTKNNGKSFFRFAASDPGEYIYFVGKNKKSFIISPYNGTNDLFLHGPLVVDKNNLHLQHRDGTPFFWLADTWWYGSTYRAHLKKEFKILSLKRKKQQFSVVQIVIGIPPEIDMQSHEMRNTGGSPFLDSGTINPDYFDSVDKKIDMLVNMGIVPCIVGGWGYHIDWYGPNQIISLWKEIIARYSAYPVVFCITGEVDGALNTQHISTDQMVHIQKAKGLVKRYAPSFVVRYIGQTLRQNRRSTSVLLKRLKLWEHIAEFVKGTDPFQRVRCIHVSGSTSSHVLFKKDNDLFSFHTLQSGHSIASLNDMVSVLSENTLDGVAMLNMEPWYEGILGNFGAYHQRMAFWISMLCGAVGHSYGAHGIWQMNRSGENFMSHWGHSSWREALSYDGATQIGKAKIFLERYHWWKLRPFFDKIHPHWSVKNNTYPLVGAIEERHLFIYFPRINSDQTFRVDCRNSLAHAKVACIDPKTMNTIINKTITEDFFTIKRPSMLIQEDLLVVISTISV